MSTPVSARSTRAQQIAFHEVLSEPLGVHINRSIWSCANTRSVRLSSVAATETQIEFGLNSICDVRRRAYLNGLWQRHPVICSRSVSYNRLTTHSVKIEQNLRNNNGSVEDHENTENDLDWTTLQRLNCSSTTSTEIHEHEHAIIKVNALLRVGLQL